MLQKNCFYLVMLDKIVMMILMNTPLIHSSQKNLASIHYLVVLLYNFIIVGEGSQNGSRKKKRLSY